MAFDPITSVVLGVTLLDESLHTSPARDRRDRRSRWSPPLAGWRCSPAQQSQAQSPATGDVRRTLTAWAARKAQPSRERPYGSRPDRETSRPTAPSAPSSRSRPGRTGWRSSTRCASAGSSPTRSASTATRPRRRSATEFGGSRRRHRHRQGRPDRRPGARRAPPRRPRLRRPPGRDRPDPADGDPRRGRRRRAARVLRPRPRRLDRRRGHGDRLRPGRADGPGRQVRAALEEPAGAARRPPRGRRPRDPLPPALPRPHPRRALAAGLPDPLLGDRDDPPGPDRKRLQRGRDAGPARPGRRRRGETVHHPPQRAEHRHDPADRARAAAQAADRRRHEPRLRDRPRLPQRGPRHPPQPRVHPARGLPGVRRLPRHDGPDRGDHRDLPARRRSAPRWSRSTARTST